MRPEQTPMPSSPVFDPSALAASTLSDAEKRQVVTHEVGNAITWAFTAHSEFVQHDEEAKTSTLQLRTPDSATVLAAHYINPEDGSHVVDLSYSNPKKYDNHWRYTIGTDGQTKLVQCRKDKETGKLVPKPPEQPGPDGRPQFGDPTSDHEVWFWGKLWPQNFYTGRPEVPKPKRNLAKTGGFLGRVGLRG